MGSEISFRLSGDELIYLCAAVTKATQIYGIKRREEDSADTEANKEKWKSVKDRLTAKQFIINDNGKLSVNGALAAIIQIVCEPKLLLAAQTSYGGKQKNGEGSPAPKCYYISRRCAVKLEEEEIAKDYYLLSFFDEKEELQADLSELYSIDEKKYGYSPNKVVLPQRSFEEYMSAITGGDENKAYEMLTELGFPDDCASDLGFGLKTKNHLITLTTLSFDSSGEKRDISNQTLLFGGKKFLWQMELCGKVYIRGTKEDIFLQKLEVISELFSYF